MSVALLLITHNKIASSLIEVASSVVNNVPENISYVEVPMDTPIGTIEATIKDKLDKLDKNDGTLILTDMYGGTPCNVAVKFSNQNNTRLISGLNLPMLIRIMNYRNLPLDELSEKTLSGGKQSISIYEGGKIDAT